MLITQSDIQNNYSYQVHREIEKQYLTVYTCTVTNYTVIEYQ